MATWPKNGFELTVLMGPKVCEIVQSEERAPTPIIRVQSDFSSEALSGDRRNSAPNTHGAEEAEELVSAAIIKGLGGLAVKPTLRMRR